MPAPAAFFNSPLVDRDGFSPGTATDSLSRLSLSADRVGRGPRADGRSARGTGHGGRLWRGRPRRRLEALRFGGFTVPVDDLGAVLVPYRGRQGSFPYVSAAAVLAGTADPRLLEGAIVLVGTTAAGLLDLRATPVQNVYPGVEVNANLIAGILTITSGADRLTRPVWKSCSWESSALLGALIGWLTPVWALLLTMAVAGRCSASTAIFGWLTCWWCAGHPAGTTGGPVHAAHQLQFFIESRRERWITRLFGQYDAHEIVAE